MKVWASLKTKKGRATHGQFLVEGLRLVRELLDSSLDVTALLWDVGTDELPADLMDTVQGRNIPFYEVSPSAFQAVSDTVTSQGVIAVAKLPAPTDDVIHPSHVLLLDGVQDPGNVGTLLRTAEAFGVPAAVCSTGTADPFSPKVVRASMGGLFRLAVRAGESVDYVHKWSHRWPGGQVVATAADASLACDEVDLTRPTILVIGSEANGVSEELLQDATHTVRIPMSGAAESLNAAMAGTILLYEVSRQRRS